MSKEFLAALDQMQHEKGIPKEEIISLIEHAVSKCLVKVYPLSDRYKVTLDRETGQIVAWGIKSAVGKVADPRKEILLSAAREIDPKVSEGDDVELPIDVDEIARIASQTIKKVITQRIREYEKISVYKKYKQMENRIVSGRVFRFIGRKAIFDFGDAEAVLPADEQIPKQFLRANSFVKTLILRVEGNEKKCEIILSRSHPEFLKQLLSDEVPEIKEGIVEIVKAVRQPGIRSKVLVKSLKEHVDPVGTCVGVRGSRIKTIISELGGEKIDLVDAAKNPAAIVASSLSPARVESSAVKINKSKKKAVVTIDPSQRGQALGQGGFNINLASELTGMEIDIEFGEKELSDTAEAGDPEPAPAVAPETSGPPTDGNIDEKKEDN
ncbi:transcription termination factor NusA [bacterium]|nr:transcription termination factor NusA [Candidatus Omnitrophota bacterium]MBU2527803.1 transcription termination factor NusA [bacterium]MBU3930718.1 transcription termination factor NusA [bacterium]MBU4122961.1 transcription termination factor NusA [bacterium]